MDGDIDHLLFEDESLIRDDQAIVRTWFLKGNQRVIYTNDRHCGAELSKMKHFAMRKKQAMSGTFCASFTP